MTDKELMQQALEMLHHINKFSLPPASICLPGEIDDVMEAISARLAQPEQEPVAWVWTVNSGAGYITRGVGFDKADIPFAKHAPLYFAPPQRQQRTYTLRKWQGLTDEEIFDALINQNSDARLSYLQGARVIEAKLKEKNG